MELILSVKSKWIEKILKGEKKEEVRRVIPKDFVGWVNLYCGKKGPTLCKVGKNVFFNGTHVDGRYTVITCLDYILNGKIVGRFWFDGYNIHVCGKDFELGPRGEYRELDEMIYFVTSEDLNNMQLTYEEMEAYGKGKTLYSMLIKQLEIFAEPKKLEDFYYFQGYTRKELAEYNHALLPKTRVTKAPQNFMYVEVCKHA